MTMLILIRHAEAQKNLQSAFSGDPQADKLTANGHAQIAELAAGVELLVSRAQFNKIIVTHASSQRATTTANALRHHATSDLIAIPELRSIDSGHLAGRSEGEILREFPEFSKHLALYRNGLLSSYHIKYPGAPEDLKTFESKVTSAVERIVRMESADLLLMIGHRSAITAILVGFARRWYGYPKDYFGYVPIDPVCSYGLKMGPDNGEIIWTNERPSRIPDLYCCPL